MNIKAIQEKTFNILKKKGMFAKYLNYQEFEKAQEKKPRIISKDKIKKFVFHYDEDSNNS